MSFIYPVRPLLELAICKEYRMARKTNGSTATPRKKKTVASATFSNVASIEGARKNVEGNKLEDEIRRRAYEIYLERNGSPGDEHQDWLSAEREVRARHQERLA
jgi:hypothetical protein